MKTKKINKNRNSKNTLEFPINQEKFISLLGVKDKLLFEAIIIEKLDKNPSAMQGVIKEFYESRQPHNWQVFLNWLRTKANLKNTAKLTEMLDLSAFGKK